MRVPTFAYAAAVLFMGGAVSANAQPAAGVQQQIETHARQAQQYLKDNRPELAAGEFAAIVSLDPNNVDARGNLGVLLFFQSEYAKAVPHLRAALKLRPALW